jgi:hypothetical protein
VQKVWHKAAVLAAIAWIIPAASSAVTFEKVVGFATKTGFRAVIAWQADQQVAGLVRYGTDPANLGQAALPVANLVDRAQMAVLDDLEPGSTVHYRILDRLSNTQSSVRTLSAANAYNSWNGATYTINALVQLDAAALPDAIPWDQGVRDLAKGIDILAERTYDALDGYARIGTVLVTDTNLDYPANLPFLPGVVCASVAGVGAVGPTVADFLVQTSVPFDSHTWGGWAISDPCTALYIGRIGQLAVPWQDDLHLGYTMAHELMHYAFDAPDLYPLNSTADCRNLAWDGSLMHNEGGWNAEDGRWELTELDRSAQLTPCDHGDEPWSWSVARSRYKNVPANANGPILDVVNRQARGNPDGGALEVWVLDHQPGTSTLARVQ